MFDLVKLVGQVRARSDAGTATLIGRFQGAAFGYALAVTCDMHLAEDATQDAFVEAMRCIDQLDDPAAFPGWLRGIVRHCSHRALRRRQAAA